MRRSRISRETTKVARAAGNTDVFPRRETRSFAAHLRSFNATDTKENERKEVHVTFTTEEDIEDLPTSHSSTRKRKIGVVSVEEGSTNPSILGSAQTTFRTVTNASNEVAAGKRAKPKRQPAKRVLGHEGVVEVKPPRGWEEVYNTMKEMRKHRTAPVDTMGCETLAEDHLSPVDKRFQTLIALMMSSQTKDTTNAIAMRRLQTELPSPGLTVQNILAVEPAKLNDMIYVVGFHNTKTKNIKATAEILRDRFGGDIPDSVEGLMSLPGVGPKMAYLCLSAAWGRTEGIGVDVHVHRITNLWAWHKTRTPEETRMTLESWLPREKWHEINHLLVGFGQTICTPVGRKCSTCKLAEKQICPSAVIERKAVKGKVRQDVSKEEVEIKVE